MWAGSVPLRFALASSNCTGKAAAVVSLKRRVPEPVLTEPVRVSGGRINGLAVVFERELRNARYTRKIRVWRKEELRTRDAGRVRSGDRAGQEPLVAAQLSILQAHLGAVIDTDRVVVDGEDRRVEQLRRVQHVDRALLEDIQRTGEVRVERVNDTELKVRVAFWLEVVDRIGRRARLLSREQDAGLPYVLKQRRGIEPAVVGVGDVFPAIPDGDADAGADLVPADVAGRGVVA